MTSRTRVLSAVAASLFASALLACHKASPPTPPPEREWQLLASELPSALLSVSGRSASDIFAVGADKGAGPEVLHFDGAKWTELQTGQHGDLWWVQALANGPVFMAGANGMVLRYDGQHFERLKMPGLEKDTVYGVWAADAENVYAVGSVAGRNGFIAHSTGGAFENEVIPPDVPRVAGGEVPGFFKVFGMGDEVWVVGANGTIVHREGASQHSRRFRRERKRTFA